MRGKPNAMYKNSYAWKGCATVDCVCCAYASNDAIHIAPVCASTSFLHQVNIHAFSSTHRNSRYAIVNSDVLFSFARARASDSMSFLFLFCTFKERFESRISFWKRTLWALMLMSTGFADVWRGKQATLKKKHSHFLFMLKTIAIRLTLRDRIYESYGSFFFNEKLNTKCQH